MGVSTKSFRKMRDEKGKLIRDNAGRFKYDIYFRMGGRASRKVHRRLWLAHATAQVVARWAEAQGLVTSVPFRAARAPEAKLSRRRAARDDEYHGILALLRRRRVELSLVWALLAHTGMRLGAACDLSEGDIDEAAGYFTVTTKGLALRGRERVRYLITPAIEEIFAEARAWKKERGIGSSRMFTTRRGSGWTAKSFDKALATVREAAVLAGESWPAGLTPHRLRKLAGTTLAEKNFSADMIQAGLGHRDRRSAAAYIDHGQKMRDEAQRALDTFLTRTEPQTPKTTGRNHALPSASNDGQTPKKCPHCGGELP